MSEIRAPDKDLIVAILVPTKAKGSAGDDPWEGSIGTGCAVGDDLILTARHVVRPAQRNAACPIRVRWYALRHDDDPQPAWYPLDGSDEEVICWVGEGDLDAALLRCPRPPELRGMRPFRIPASRPPGTAVWESRGFPAAGHTGSRSRHGDFIGNVMSMGSRDRVFSVTSDLASGDKREDWSGASGMPVLIGDAIVGVVKAVPAKSDDGRVMYENRLLHAVPSSLLRADRAFCDLLGDTSLPDLIDQARKLILDVLCDCPTAQEALKARLAPECGSAAACGEAIAQVALSGELPLKALVDRAIEARYELRRNGDEAGADCIARFVGALLPVGSAPEEVEKITSSGSSAATTLIWLDAHSPTLVEILMAAADRRAAHFRTLQDRRAHPFGQGCLANVPEGGRDPAGVQRLHDITTDLVQMFEGSFCDDLDRAILGHLKCVLPDDWQTPAADLSDAERAEFECDVIEQINEELHYRALALTGDPERFSYYMIIETPAALSDKERERRDAVLARIKQRFPRIAVLCTAPRPRLPRRELEPFGNLRNLLYTPPPET